MLSRLVVAFFLFNSFAAEGMAQSSGAVTGSVAGTVICADTNAPARFAIVTLEPLPGQKDEAAMRAAGGSMSVGDKVVGSFNASATTDINGRFFLDRVPPGKYFAIGGLAGYLNPIAEFSKEQLRAMTEETQKELMAKLTTVTVDADQTASVSVRLEHASSISGTVRYDDGSPAVSVFIHLLHKETDGKLVAAKTGITDSDFSSDTKTDDFGHFRIMGVAPGDYVVEVKLLAQKIEVEGLLSGGSGTSAQLGTESSGLTIYSGNSFRSKSAAEIKVENDDPVDGVDITIPLNGLHVVRGYATAMRDGHALDSGQVELLYADDREEKMTADVKHDGSFTLPNVPEDRYVLRLSGVKSYAAVEAPLVVQGDVSGVTLAAPDRTKATAIQR